MTSRPRLFDNDLRLTHSQQFNRQVPKSPNARRPRLDGATNDNRDELVDESRHRLGRARNARACPSPNRIPERVVNSQKGRTTTDNHHGNRSLCNLGSESVRDQRRDHPRLPPAGPSTPSRHPIIRPVRGSSRRGAAGRCRCLQSPQQPGPTHRVRRPALSTRSPPATTSRTTDLDPRRHPAIDYRRPRLLAASGGSTMTMTMT